MATNYRSRVIKTLKLHGLLLSSDACKYLVESLQLCHNENLDENLDRIIDLLQKQTLLSTIIDKGHIQAAIEECQQKSFEGESKVFNIIDVFKTQKHYYNCDKKKFLPDNRKLDLFGSAEDKAYYFRERYNLIYQRTIRHELFCPPSTGNKSIMKHRQQQQFELKPIDYLLSNNRIEDKLVILGMITRHREGGFALEDITGTIKLDVSKALFHAGLFTEGCFVLAEGIVEDGIFQAAAIGFPPAEPAESFYRRFGDINLFGGPFSRSFKSSVKLKAFEERNNGAMMIFLSDVWLDQPAVMEKLRVLFTGYSNVSPTAFVLIGNYLSAPYGYKETKILKECLQNLSDLICEFNNIKERSHFVFVPGVHDVGFGNILPRPPLPDSITAEIRERLPLTHFASNPCRIQYCTQDIVIFREDMIGKVCRNCIHIPEDGEDIPSHFVRTIMSQATLCPLPLNVSPVYWNYSHALSLYPPPSLVVLANNYEPFMTSRVDSLCINPGSFSRNDFTFQVYLPSNGEVERSQVTH